MGQYHKTVNLTKRQYLNPHALGAGLKLIEQAGTHLGVGSALIVLLTCSNGRGGGDLAEASIVGSWAGDRLAIVGDYAEDSDLENRDQASLIYSLCATPEDLAREIARLRSKAAEYEAKRPGDKTAETMRIKADRLDDSEPYQDISAEVAEILESTFGFKYTGDGWRDLVFNDGSEGQKMLVPDMVFMSRQDPPGEGESRDPERSPGERP